MHIETPNYIVYDDGRVFCKRSNRFVGYTEKNRYLRFYNTEDGKKTLIHRFVWEAFRGEIPNGMQVNHRNGVKDDNRLVNLELVSNQQNQQHRGKPSYNTSGHKNIYWHKPLEKWKVHIQLNGKTKHYGYFDKIEDAIARRNEVIQQLNAQGHRYIVEFPEV